MVAFYKQKILPAIRKMKDFDQFLNSSYEYGVLLDSHVAQLESIVRTTKQANKKLLLHADLVHGLKNDEYATEFLAQYIQPAGLISTRANVLLTAKKKGLLAIQRMFLLDTNALEKGYEIVSKINPDYIEVLPGVMPHIIQEVSEKTRVPVFAGGLIRSVNDVEQAILAGASAVTSSRKDLWGYFEGEMKKLGE